MWNRVVLVMCGMIIGWGATNYLTCATDDMPRHRYRIGLGAGIALALALWMGWARPASGVTAFVIVAFCAVIAYAARARQVSSLREQPIMFGDEKGETRQPCGVVLVTQAHPERYSGPEHWIAYLRPSGNAARQDTGWFSRPGVLARIRRSYAAGRALPGTARLLTDLAEQVSLRLGSACSVRTAHPFAAPAVTTQMMALRLEQVQKIAIVPIDLPDHHQAAVADQVARSSADLQGTAVVLSDNVQLGVWTEEIVLEELGSLIGGQTLAREVTVPANAADHLARSIQRFLQHAEPGDTRAELSQPTEATTQASS